MSPIIKGLTAFTLFFFSISLFSQDCDALDLLSVGQVMTYSSFNAKSEKTDSHTASVLSKQNTHDGILIEIDVAFYDGNEKIIQESTAKYSCNGDVISLDIIANYSGNTEAYPNQKMEIIQNENRLPINPAIGDKLTDAKLVINYTMNGSTSFGGMDASYINRKVLAKETLTTPAGSFECFKIQSEFEIIINILGIELPTRGNSIGYFSPSLGMVKSENFNTEGELTSYSLLTKLKK